MPEMMAKMMMGSMLLRLIRPLKSSTVRVLTIISLIFVASCMAASPMEMEVLAAGGQMLTTTSTRIAAQTPVAMKVITMLPRILPRRLMFSMLPTAVVMDTKTMGTTMVNIRLIKIWPMGWSTVAFSPKITPITAPTMMPARSISGKR